MMATRPSRTTDANHFGQGVLRWPEMVQGDATDHQIEAARAEGQLLHASQVEGRIADASFVRQGVRLADHLRRQITAHHVQHMRRQRQCGVAGAGRHIQHLPGRLWLYQLDQAPQTRTRACTVLVT